MAGARWFPGLWRGGDRNQDKSEREEAASEQKLKVQDKTILLTTGDITRPAYRYDLRRQSCTREDVTEGGVGEGGGGEEGEGTGGGRRGRGERR